MLQWRRHAFRRCGVEAHLLFLAAINKRREALCGRSSVQSSVRLIVRSVCQTRYDKTKETPAHIFKPHKRTIILSFRHEEWLVGDDPFYVKFWAKLTPLEQKRRFSIDIRSYSASAITPSEKSSIITYRKSTTRFPMSLRRTAYVVAKPQRELKNAKWSFSVKTALHSGLLKWFLKT